MSAFGYLFLLGGVLIIRQVIVGRVKDTPGDARDLFLAFVNADTGEMASVLSRRGENVSVSVSGEVATDTETETRSPSQFGDDVIGEMQRLGNNAAGYRLGAEGPTYFDCSGLVWRAVKNLGLYNGPRFTTSNFRHIASGWAYQTPTPARGDLVLWPAHHIGVYLGNDQMYSARSTAKGIGISAVSGDSGYFGGEPQYWRIAAHKNNPPVGAV